VSELSREERIAELWSRGRLRWKLYEDQREVYDQIRAFLDDPDTRYEQFWFDISRQWGKTFLGVLISTESALRNPEWLIGYTSATRTALWQFVQPNMDVLIADCPADIRPYWNGLDNSYRFHNGSRIHLAGVNNGHENDARGPRRNLVVNEELGFVDRVDYLLDSVVIPMLTTTGGRILNITTPAETPAHESFARREECRLAKRYVRRTIDDNRHLSVEAKEKLISKLGGRNSTAARRELFCEWVTDDSRAIVPEYADAADLEIAATEPLPPTYEQPIVAMDVGFEDAHHILFGYYDFRRAKRVIQAEESLTRATTDKIAAAIKATEERLWGAKARAAAGLPELKEPVRWSDTDLRLIADLHELHKLNFNPTEKDDKEAQVNALRISVKGRGWHISPSCVKLRRQLRLGVWNKQRTEFDRTKEDGHFDAVDAGIYFNRNCPIYTNPYPAFPEHVNRNTHHLPFESRQPQSQEAEALSQFIGRRMGNA
jgi:hypothetical protein